MVSELITFPPRLPIRRRIPPAARRSRRRRRRTSGRARDRSRGDVEGLLRVAGRGDRAGQDDRVGDRADVDVVAGNGGVQEARQFADVAPDRDLDGRDPAAVAGEREDGRLPVGDGGDVDAPRRAHDGVGDLRDRRHRSPPRPRADRRSPTCRRRVAGSSSAAARRSSPAIRSTCMDGRAGQRRPRERQRADRDRRRAECARERYGAKGVKVRASSPDRLLRRADSARRSGPSGRRPHPRRSRPIRRYRRGCAARDGDSRCPNAARG